MSKLIPNVLEQLKSCKTWTDLEKRIALLITHQQSDYDRVILLNSIYGYVSTDMIKEFNND